MKKITLITAFTFVTLLGTAQQQTISNLRYKLSISNSDTAKFSTLDSLAMCYLFFSTKQDSTLFFINQSMNLAVKQEDKRCLILGYARLGFYFVCTSQFKSAIDASLKGISISEQYRIKDYLSALHYNLAWIYANINNTELELENCRKSQSYFQYDKDKFLDQPVHVLGQMSVAYLNKGMLDSSFFYATDSYNRSLVSKESIAKDISLWYLGINYIAKKDYQTADSLLLLGIEQCSKNSDRRLLAVSQLTLAGSLLSQHKPREAIEYAADAMKISEALNDKGDMSFSAKSLYNCYDQLNMKDSAYYYLKVGNNLYNQVLSTDISSQVQQVSFEKQIKDKEEESSRNLQNEKNRRRMVWVILIAAVVVFLFIAYMQWRNNKHKQQANHLLQQQKNKVEAALAELKATQSQLIQSEKMASLGELTAGIAHEIQNPLNFVNNFSEVSNELIAEMKEQINKGNYGDAGEIANDVKENLEKINHHGKRAAAIVKSMLQHSRSSSGKKEPTDINALCDEYLRLSYHGLRAKDKSFNATMKTDFDTSIGNINIVSQDMGRVILNLLTNAFYAVNEKGKENIEGYEPVVSVSTKRIDNRLEIQISDNGNGIPDAVKEKIFQPFFTTKPTGQGTGLGLSLSYDIVKAHGGELIAASAKGDGTSFTINLPVA